MIRSLATVQCDWTACIAGASAPSSVQLARQLAPRGWRLATTPHPAWAGYLKPGQAAGPVIDLCPPHNLQATGLVILRARTQPVP